MDDCPLPPVQWRGSRSFRRVHGELGPRKGTSTHCAQALPKSVNTTWLHFDWLWASGSFAQMRNLQDQRQDWKLNLLGLGLRNLRYLLECIGENVQQSVQSIIPKFKQDGIWELFRELSAGKWSSEPGRRWALWTGCKIGKGDMQGRSRRTLCNCLIKGFNLLNNENEKQFAFFVITSATHLPSTTAGQWPLSAAS